MQLRYDDVLKAEKVLDGNVKKTPMIRADKLGIKLGCELFLKLECLQLTSSFKARGAHLAITNATYENPGKGLIAMSAGNHAQAVA